MNPHEPLTPWTRDAANAVLRSPRWYDRERELRVLADDLRAAMRETGQSLFEIAFNRWQLNPKQVREVRALLKGAAA